MKNNIFFNGNSENHKLSNSLKWISKIPFKTIELFSLFCQFPWTVPWTVYCSYSVNNSWISLTYAVSLRSSISFSISFATTVGKAKLASSLFCYPHF